MSEYNIHRQSAPDLTGSPSLRKRASMDWALVVLSILRG